MHKPTYQSSRVTGLRAFLEAMAAMATIIALSFLVNTLIGVIIHV